MSSTPAHRTCRRNASFGESRAGRRRRPLILTSSDGNRFAAALAESPDPHGSAVVVLPDVRGLYRFYVELVERLAEAGHHAIALDYFGRTAGAEERGEDLDFAAEVPKTRVETVQLDLAAARSALAERTGATSVVSLGFCFGGTHSFIAGTNPELGLDGVIGFYGLLDPTRVGKARSRSSTARDSRSGPGPFRGADQDDPGRGRRGLRPPLITAGVEHEIVTYPGAPHSFFDKTAAEHAEASRDAWNRVLDFLGEPLA